MPEYDYRDGGMVGDALVEAVIRGAHDHLEPGGVAQLLGNWEYRDGGAQTATRAAPPTDSSASATGPPRSSIGSSSARCSTSPSTPRRGSATGGTRPGTAEFDRLYDAWLDDFAARGVSHVGFGYVLLRRADAAASADSTAGAGRLARLERLHGPLGSNEAGLGAHLADCLVEHDRQAALDDAALAAARFTTAGDVTEERHYWPGDDDPTAMLLRQGGGFGRAISLDTGLAALVGASDGDLSVGAIVSALAQLLEVDETALAADLLPAVRTLVDDGMLRFAD
ncbi:PqqD family protein [Agromyces cerinus subsp. nitratus]|uniref:PqqD family protein n=1 Tax=Agromyces cerinus TaxID=33878 RepID=UPI00363FAA14